MSHQVKHGQEKGEAAWKNKKQMMSKKGGRQLYKNKKNVPATPKLCDNSRVYFTTEGAQYMALDVGAGDTSSSLKVVTRAMWELVTLHPTGYLDGRAVWLLAKFLGLHGFRIVKHEDGHLVPCDAGGPISSEECPMVLYDGYGHFKALIPLRRMPLVSLVCFQLYVCAYVI